MMSCYKIKSKIKKAGVLVGESNKYAFYIEVHHDLEEVKVPVWGYNIQFIHKTPELNTIQTIGHITLKVCKNCGVVMLKEE